MKKQIFQVGSLKVEASVEKRDDGGHWDALRVSLGKKAFTTLDRYEANLLRTAIEDWLAECLARDVK